MGFSIAGVSRAGVVFLGGVILAFAPMIAGDAKAASAPEKSVVVVAKDIYEDCRKLEANEAFDYGFEADGNLDFNVHYHEGDEIFMPIEQFAVEAGEGRFQAEITQSYCLMWTSQQDEDIELRYWVK